MPRRTRTTKTEETKTEETKPRRGRPPGSKNLVSKEAKESKESNATQLRLEALAAKMNDLEVHMQSVINLLTLIDSNLGQVVKESAENHHLVMCALDGESTPNKVKKKEKSKVKKKTTKKKEQKLIPHLHADMSSEEYDTNFNLILDEICKKFDKEGVAYTEEDGISEESYDQMIDQELMKILQVDEIGTLTFDEFQDVFDALEIEYTATHEND